jgi:hypothetical protein
VAAQQSPTDTQPTILVTPLSPSDEVSIDGVLDELVWERATPATGFRQRDPDNGASATERTEVRLLYDSDRLILGVTLYDSEPGRVLGNQMQRDQSFAADDRFMWTVDTFLDGRSGFFFEINPAGAMGDALVTSATGGSFGNELGAVINRSWDGIWLARVRRTNVGWTAEVEIPFRTLNFDPNADTWGINFQRTVRRKNEESLWTSYERNQGLARMSNAGRVTGLRNLSQGVGLDIKPYIVGNLSSAPGRGRPDRSSSADLGLDAFYNITPALRATMSINTDFAETEVDQRRVNLTRFPLVFPEKRDFFLAGASYFQFRADPGQDVAPFFSRRIGLDDTGVPQRIDFGAKLTGQAGAFDLGALQVRTATAGLQPGEDFSVLRVRRRAGQQSYVGGLYTRRAARAGGADHHTAAVDTILRTSSFRGRDNLEFNGYYIWTSNPLGTGDSSVRGFLLSYPNDPVRADFLIADVGPHYAPAVGFAERPGIWRINPQGGYRWRPRNHPFLRDMDFFFEVTRYWSHPGNRLLTVQDFFTPLRFDFHDGSNIRFEIRRHYEWLDQQFEISRGVILPSETDYAFRRYAVIGATADRRPVSVSSNVEFGEFFSGERRDVTVALGVRPRRGVAVTLEAQRNVLDLAEGSFDTNIFRALANTQFSPWLSIGNNLQYDSVSRVLGWQMRFRWIHRPGNDLFFVYTHNWLDFSSSGAQRFDTLDSRAATKIVYTQRF